MTLLEVGIVVAIGAGVGGLAVHHQFRQARQARIRTEADAYGGRRDEAAGVERDG
jgi:cation diffusion facilitator CzcD-associated flavoprotein CzcO